ncbi:MAG: T9SS type A sorting domain-containing protein [Bacteroidia bacterium]|nr:T9SS type A sorting domain-containing protein [Bacteroidia bacterium]
MTKPTVRAKIANPDSILFEENLIDHNGWSQTIPGAPATGFSHNTYFQSNCRNLEFRNNIVSRASAVGGGIRCGGSVYNNLFLSNPRNLFIGSFDPAQINWPTEGVEGELAYNVILGARPELGSVFYDPGNGITLERVRNVSVHHNIIAHFTEVSEGNTGIGINRADNVSLNNNIIYNWGNNQTSGLDFASGITLGDNLQGVVSLSHNDVQMKNTQGYCINKWGGFANTSFSDSRYHNVVSASNWFSIGSFSDWSTASGETNPQQIDVNYADPERDISTYLTAVGQTGGLAEFIQLRKQMSQSNWNPDYTAQSVNNYIREGFGIPAISNLAEEVSIQEVFIYPNPNISGMFTLNLKTNPYSSLKIFNEKGQLLLRKNNPHNGEIIDLSSHSPGIYFFLLEGKDKNFMIKAVKP